MSAFLGVKGSPVQIRPSRRRSKAGSGFQLPAFGCNGSARALPSVAPTKRSGVPCRAGILTSDYWHSARPRAGSRPSPADSGELSSRSRGRRFGSGRQRLVLGTNSRRGAAPASGYHFVPPGSSPPCDVDRTGLPMLIATADGQYADLPTGGHSAAVAIVTDGDNLHRVAPVCPATDRRFGALEVGRLERSPGAQIARSCAA